MNVRIGTLCMMAATAVSTLCAELLENAFRDPPREAGVWVWWHWQGNNVTREGITLDLEAMRDSGVAGATQSIRGAIWSSVCPRQPPSMPTKAAPLSRPTPIRATASISATTDGP